MTRGASRLRSLAACVGLCTMLSCQTENSTLSGESSGTSAQGSGTESTAASAVSADGSSESTSGEEQTPWTEACGLTMNQPVAQGSSLCPAEDVPVLCRWDRGPDSNSFDYTYADDGRVVNAGSQAYAYDGTGKMIGYAGDGHEFRYDDEGRLELMGWRPVDGEPTMSWGFGYDNLGNLVLVERRQPEFSTDYHLTWSESGALQQVTHGDDLEFSQLYTLDEEGRLASTSFETEFFVFDDTITYGPMGLETWTRSPEPGVTTFEYADAPLVVPNTPANLGSLGTTLYMRIGDPNAPWVLDLGTTQRGFLEVWPQWRSEYRPVARRVNGELEESWAYEDLSENTIEVTASFPNGDIRVSLYSRAQACAIF